MWDGAIQTFDTVEDSIDTPKNRKQKTRMCRMSEVVGLEPTSEEAALDWLNKILNPLAIIGIVFLFMVLILFNGKDLHDRFLKLLGGNLNIGTDALDDAGKVSEPICACSYWSMSLMVFPWRLGWLLFGVPAAMMWGLVAVVMRFCTPCAPDGFSYFSDYAGFRRPDPGWDMVLWTVGLILVLELISNNVIEPWLYGESTGLSTLAIIRCACPDVLDHPLGTGRADLVDAFDCLPAGFVQLTCRHWVLLKLCLAVRQYCHPSERFYQRLVADEVNDAMQVANDYICAQLPKKPSAEAKVARRVRMLSLWRSGHSQPFGLFSRT